MLFFRGEGVALFYFNLNFIFVITILLQRGGGGFLREDTEGDLTSYQFVQRPINFVLISQIIVHFQTYILKVKKIAESAFQSQKICGKSA